MSSCLSFASGGDLRLGKPKGRCNDINRGGGGCGGSDGGGNNVVDSIECYACTQVGVPVFHSTSYDGVYQPEWEASAGSSIVPIRVRTDPRFNGTQTRQPRPTGIFGSIVDPRSSWVRRGNQVFVLARGISLAIDPLFFYTMSLSMGKQGAPCLLVNYQLAAFVTILRTCIDAVHMWHLWLQFKLAYVSRESLVIGCGKLVWDPKSIAAHYIRSLREFWLDIFVILPVLQLMFWLFVLKVIQQEKFELATTMLLLIFLFQFLPKLFHSFHLSNTMRKVTGYVFGSIWWRFGISLIAYLIASHVIGGCWYMLVTRSVLSCLKEHCDLNGNCNISKLCSKDVCYEFLSTENKFRNQCGNDTKMILTPMCLDPNGAVKYGLYKEGLLIVSSSAVSVKILYPIYWGLLNLSTVGNVLEPTSNLVQVTFSIFIVLCGLTLFTLMVGNIQVFLSVLLSKHKKMQLRRRDIEWWMRRRHLPLSLRRRVRHSEQQRWDVLGDGGLDWVDELPEGLRRDIKRYLCLDLVKKVPLFHHVDDLVLDNICDRAKPLIFSKGEKIYREGDPVPRMVFIMRGRVKRSQSLSKSMVATSVLEPGSFLGDELLSWCLRHSYMDGLPASTATFVCTKSTEAYALEAEDIRYVTDNFRYSFTNDRLRRTMRYYSSNWRTWAAVNIQHSWRRYRMRSTEGITMDVLVNGSVEDRLRRYTSMFLSLRPHDHLD